MTLDQLTKRREKFEAFLNERGAQILQPTNEWEVLRFKTKKGVSIIYKNARDGLTFTGESDAAWAAFQKNGSWRGTPAKKRISGRDKTLPFFNALLNRDGSACFYCGSDTDENNRSIEHLVALAHGGPNHMSNMVLAHRRCNSNAGHLSAMEKIRLREDMRASK